VANLIPPRPEFAEENINTLKSMLSSPLVGVVPAISAIRADIVAENLAL